MGVPALFRWLSTKYPKIISSVVEERPRDVNGEQIPVDTTAPNPNGEEFHNLYLDMNGIVHPCAHPEDGPAPATEQDMMLEVFKYTDRVVNMVRPRRLLMIAVDGVAPRAKMNQQRSRRFRSAKEAKEKDDEKAEFLKLLKSQNNGVLPDSALEQVDKKTWDSNAITPGTPFMHLLAESLRYWVAYKLNTDPMWANLKIIISDATVPGEGEHKIMEFVRSQRTSPDHDPNTRHVIYGLDADLIMLGLATHEPHFRVLREDVWAQSSKPRTCRICGQVGHFADECRGEAKQKQGEFDEKGKTPELKPFVWLHVSVLREYLEIEMRPPFQNFDFDLERAIDDWVFMCFFVGNDFLPHLPSLEIRDEGIDTLIAIWRDNAATMGGYVTKDGHVNLERAQYILAGLAKQEDSIFQRRRQVELRKEEKAKRRKIDDDRRNKRQSAPEVISPNFPGFEAVSLNTLRDQNRGYREGTLITGNLNAGANGITHDMVVNRNSSETTTAANKSAAAVLKERMQAQKSNTNSNGNSAEVAALFAEHSGSGDPETPVAAGKRKRELIEDAENGTPGSDSPNQDASQDGSQNAYQTPKEGEESPDNVRLWEDGYADRYYEQKFNVDPKDIEFRHKVARAYVEGLAWVLLYYFQGCPSWNWYYPYHYAPFAADFVDLSNLTITFEQGKPFRPYEQLMGVMPAASSHTLPEVFRGLMSDEDSEIVDFYPEDFRIDLNGKKWAWQGVAILPFIDEGRLLEAMAKKYPLLSDEETARNALGHDVLFFSDRHDLYEPVAANFYSKRQGAPEMVLNQRVSHGLAGQVAKNPDYLPQSALTSPLTEGDMPDVDEDHSINVYFQLIKSKNTHKSMLLRGLEMPPAALDKDEKADARERAHRTGRQFGGAPLRNERRGGGYGGGRGRGGGGGGGGSGRINYADSGPPPRGNPVAQHLDPNFDPSSFRPPAPPHLMGAPPYGVMPPPPPGSDFGFGGPRPMPPFPAQGGGGYGYGYGGGREAYVPPGGPDPRSFANGQGNGRNGHQGYGRGGRGGGGYR